MKPNKCLFERDRYPMNRDELKCSNNLLDKDPYTTCGKPSKLEFDIYAKVLGSERRIVVCRYCSEQCKKEHRVWIDLVRNS
jgi:hypothetical protein